MAALPARSELHLMNKWLQYRLRTIRVFVALISCYLAAWVWTSTHGVSQLEKHYAAEIKTFLQHEVDTFQAPYLPTANELFVQHFENHYFQNPHSPFSFVIVAESNFSLISRTYLRTQTSHRHIWFFGYVSEPL